MIAPSELRALVIAPVCNYLGLGGVVVEELLLATAMQESQCGAHLRQVGGPALGVWQMEPRTHDDIWENFLAFRVPLAAKISTFLFTGLPRVEQLVGNLYYSCAMARVQYYRSPRPLPPAGDLEAQAAYYKIIYNTALGAATTAQYLANARRVLV